jgi:hypothetical protein
MESVNDVRYKQHTVIEFLVSEKESVRNIHKHQHKQHWFLGKKSTGSKTGKTELHDFPHSGHLVTSVSPNMLQHADAIICKDRYITT